MTEVILPVMLVVLLVGFFASIYRVKSLQARNTSLEEERYGLRREVEILNTRITYIREDEVKTAEEARDKAIKELARYKKAAEKAPVIKSAKKTKAPLVDLFLDI